MYSRDKVDPPDKCRKARFPTRWKRRLCHAFLPVCWRCVPYDRHAQANIFSATSKSLAQTHAACRARKGHQSLALQYSLAEKIRGPTSHHRRCTSRRGLRNNTQCRLPSRRHHRTNPSGGKRILIAAALEPSRVFSRAKTSVSKANPDNSDLLL